jgi:ATP-dependent RNA helicase MSS116
MFNAMRRCPTSVSRLLSAPSLAPRTVQLSLSQVPIAARRIVPRAVTVRVATFHDSAAWRQVAAAKEASTGEDVAQEPITKFADLAKRGLVHPNIINVVTKNMKLETMTDVQTASINEALSGVDM